MNNIVTYNNDKYELISDVYYANVNNIVFNQSNPSRILVGKFKLVESSKHINNSTRFQTICIRVSMNPTRDTQFDLPSYYKTNYTLDNKADDDALKLFLDIVRGLKL